MICFIGPQKILRNKFWKKLKKNNSIENHYVSSYAYEFLRRNIVSVVKI